MDARARRFARPLWLLIAATSLPIAACANSSEASQGNSLVSGSETSEWYVADVSEAPAELGLSSSLELRSDGHFDWRFRTAQLTLSAHGDWDRDGEMIHLSNPQQVGEPAVELASSTSDPGVGLRVGLDPATARMASVIEAELEFPGEQFVRVPLTGGPIGVPASEERPVAVRLMSESFSIRTPPIAVPTDGDNVLMLRLVPADFGQAFFGSQQTHFDQSGMIVDWRGISLRYNRANGPPAAVR